MSQLSLFGNLDEFTLWKQEWKGMPEFVQEKLEPYKLIKKAGLEINPEVDEYGMVLKQSLCKSCQKCKPVPKEFIEQCREYEPLYI